jgi:hypothetical protein
MADDMVAGVMGAVVVMVPAYVLTVGQLQVHTGAQALAALLGWGLA